MSATTSDRLSSAWFEEMFGRLSITEQRILPSWWLSTGLLEVARPAQTQSELFASLGEAAKFLALLVANGLFLQLITGWTASHLYRLGYSQLACEQPLRGRRRPMGWFDQFISMSGTATGRPIRLLLVKDLRLFRRDVTQWSQFAIFFGLLAALLRKCAIVQLQRHLFLDDWVFERCRYWSDSLYIYNSLYLPHDQLGRKAFLDSWTSAGESRSNCVE